jgi:hypothetical protein
MQNISETVIKRIRTYVVYFNSCCSKCERLVIEGLRGKWKQIDVSFSVQSTPSEFGQVCAARDAPYLKQRISNLGKIIELFLGQGDLRG